MAIWQLVSSRLVKKEASNIVWGAHYVCNINSITSAINQSLNAAGVCAIKCEK